VRRVCRAGAGIVALDATQRRRRKGQSLAEILARMRHEVRVAVMADIASFDEGLRAAELGVDVIATTLHGYTGTSQTGQTPAFGLLKKLVQNTRVPVILEGRVRTPDHLKRAFDLGAYAVVVGTAITGMEWLVRRFVEATPSE
jgi:N-acylglucosamine-6-phosphate 2-epimerase